MRTRTVAVAEVVEIGLGCMNLSHAYGPKPSAEAGAALLRRSLEVGYTFIDTANLYGGGSNETLIGETLASHRKEFFLASKGGLSFTPEGKRIVDGRPETLKENCEASLKRLKTDVLDLYYLHRLDRNVPIEDSVGALSDLVKAGKVKALGLSEVSAANLRRAHAVHPISALQSEYSLWTRNAEVAALDACLELDVTYVAFCPLARGFLAGSRSEVDSLPPEDLRKPMPRFQPDNLAHNLTLLPPYRAIAQEVGCTMGQLALAWLLTKHEKIVPIPGTTRTDHLEENIGAAGLRLDAGVMQRLEDLINPTTVWGHRYTPAAQADIDTEDLP